MSLAKDVFLDALDLDPADRAAFVRERCGGDEEAAQEVFRLLASHSGADELFGARVGPAPDLQPGDRIGPYELVEPIGEGGFATVWRASQEEPIRREVALKLLKPGLETERVVARFEAERSALALMDHPGIAKVLDGGVTEAGRPWFTMELVDGLSITEHCEARALDKDARLELVLEVCRAVQHAHQKGVVHRDLKPSNVLVAEIDGRAVPKVIDFGIAKAIQEDPFSPGTALTLEGQVIGTPAYMSPEQVDAAVDVDTRADVYAIGVLLYELLSGARPFEDETLAEAGLAEILRIIREVEPPRPSARETTTHVPARAVRGDLDWIVMKCLEKDRERRYGSAGLLAEELERHLAGEPVMAGPPDLAYRASKFARRHRIEIGFAATVAVLLVAGTIVSVTQMLRARDAEAAQRIELEKLKQVSGFYESILLGADPAVSQGQDTELVMGILGDAVQRVDGELGGDAPEVEAAVRRAIGGAYRGLGEAERAEEQLLRAAGLFEGVDEVAHLDVRRHLGALLSDRERFDDARVHLEAAASGLGALLPEGAEQRLRAESGLALLLRHGGELDAAETAQRALLAAWRLHHGDESTGALQEMNNLALTLKDRGGDGSTEEAIELLTELVVLERNVRGPRHPSRLKALNNLGELLLTLGRNEDAVPYLEEALEIKLEVLPEGHQSLVVGLNNVASLRQRLGEHDLARDHFERALEMVETRGEEATPVGIRLRFNHAICLDRCGDMEAALAGYERCHELAAGALGETHVFALQMDAAGAWQLVKLGRAEEAEPRLALLLTAFDERTAEDLAGRGVTRVRLGVARKDLGRPAEARALIEEGLGLMEESGRIQTLGTWVEIAEAALAEL